MEPSSDDALFGGPFGGLDDHYPSIEKRDRTPYPTQLRVKCRSRAKGGNFDWAYSILQCEELITKPNVRVCNLKYFSQICVKSKCFEI